MKFATALLILMFVAPARGRPARGDVATWDALLKEFVNRQHLVDYARLKREASNRLDDYVASLGDASVASLAPDQRKALLINAYNAFTIQWIVKNYPVASIWSTSAPFTEPRHKLGGETLSLDQIESELRSMGDPRIHAALVCAARSCPPLRREAYRGDRLDQQLDDNVREWLANPALNRFDPGHERADVSPIFEWYSKDFQAYPGGLDGFLGKYAPPGSVSGLGNQKLQIRLQSYNWTLNDQADTDYSEAHFAWDRLRNWFLSLDRR